MSTYPPRRTNGYITALRGDLSGELAELPTKRRYPLPDIPSQQWAVPDTSMLARVLDGLRRL
ncbi:hypothetical protein [Haloactinomyces albus]|uniref:Uncharacterized protein n=1 Tax=Haloactinomyces albus TaxID=1352928 RepID=A0AAE4CMC5_9ACTN|nr:hypothetical protein [Haloactinomyces albus]MDR7302246.1 hypothetical protein [Haloactinomyces albus]